MRGGPGSYEERLSRIRRTIDLEPVDRIPFVYMGSAFAPRFMGVTTAEYCADPEVRADVTLATMDRLGGDFDGINQLPAGRITLMLSALWLSRVAVPGRDLPDDSLWQVDEREVMTVEDYDTIIDRGWSEFRGAYMSRVIDTEELEAGLAWLATGVSQVAPRSRSNVCAAVDPCRSSTWICTGSRTRSRRLRT
jgi:hypothetical protein